LLLNHLKVKPEVRDLLQDLVANMHGQGGQGSSGATAAPGTPNRPLSGTNER
jgi:hypothetical protein